MWPAIVQDASLAPGRHNRAFVASLAFHLVLRHAFTPADNNRLAHLAGALDAHLRVIESAFGVRISRRNEAFRIDGAKPMAERALALLQMLYARAARPIGEQALQMAIAESVGRGDAAADDP